MAEYISPGRLYLQATDEFPDDPEAKKRRFKELLIEHGLLVKREPGDAGGTTLPCGYDLRTGDA